MFCILTAERARFHEMTAVSASRYPQLNEDDLTAKKALRSLALARLLSLLHS